MERVDLATGEILPLFDYAKLEPNVRRVAAEAAAVIRHHGKSATESIVAIGEQLSRVKDALGHGNYLGWLEHEFGWSEDTAGRFVQVWRLAGHIPQIAEYPIDISALYLLARPSTPEPVRGEFIRRASGGERVRHSDVRSVLQEERDRAERAFPREPLWSPSDIPSQQPAEPSPDPEQQADFRLASAFGGRMRDMDPLMAEPRAQLIKALRSRWGIRPAGLAHASKVHAWLGEIIEALEDSYENAA